jgi:putative copper resistance protein D
VLLTTGPGLLSQRGVALLNPVAWPFIVSIKLNLVAILLILTLLHDLLLGPRVSRASEIPASSRTAWERTVVQTARWLPRLSLLTALAVVIAAATLARS